MIDNIDTEFSGDDWAEQQEREHKVKSRKIRTLETLWNEPLEHACSWLPPRSPITGADRYRYQSIRPIRLVADTVAEEYLRQRAIFDPDGLRVKRAFERYQTITQDKMRVAVVLKINDKGYTINFANPGSLDFSKIVPTIIGNYRCNGTVVLAIPYKEPAAWYHTWKGLWNRVRSFVKREA
jgi:hypothetical protein